LTKKEKTLIARQFQNGDLRPEVKSRARLARSRGKKGATVGGEGGNQH